MWQFQMVPSELSGVFNLNIMEGGWRGGGGAVYMEPIQHKVKDKLYESDSIFKSNISINHTWTAHED